MSIRFSRLPSSRPQRRSAPRGHAAVGAAVESLERRQLLSVTLASVSTLTGNAGNGPSGESSASADGRYVVFSSLASDLVPGDVNGVMDIFLRDTTANTTTLVSMNAPKAAPANGRSFAPVISADGRYVTFGSEGTDLVPGDNNGHKDVFRWDRTTNTTQLVSQAVSGGFGNKDSGEPSISADGRFIAFSSSGTNLAAAVADTNGVRDVFVRDMNPGGTTKLVSFNSANSAAAAGDSFDPTISATGQYVAFRSSASDIAGPDLNGAAIDVYLRDTAAAGGVGTSTLVSVNAGGTGSGNKESTSSSVSANGRLVVFRSGANDLTGQDTNNDDDVFLRNADTNGTTLLSLNRTRTASGHGLSEFPSVSSDGHFAAFSSTAADLVDASIDTNGATEDVFIRDLQSGPITLLSGALAGGSANGRSFDTYTTRDGTFVTFSSDASNMATNDLNSATDVYLSNTNIPTQATDTTPPTAVVNPAVAQQGVDLGDASYTFNVTLADNIALNTVTLGDLTVTNPNGTTQVAHAIGVLGSGTSATATYQIAAPSGSFGSIPTDGGTYVVGLPAGAIKDVAGNTAVANPNIGAFAVTVPDPTAPDLVATITSKIPVAVITGKTKGSVSVKVTNIGATVARGKIPMNFYLSDDNKLDASDVPVNVKPVVKSLKLKTNKSATYKARFLFPLAVADGGYYVIAKVDPTNLLPETRERNNTAVSNTTIALRKPFTDLKAVAVLSPHGVLAAGGKVSNTLTLQNLGNVKFSGPVNIQFGVTPDAINNPTGVPVAPIVKKLKFGANSKNSAVKLKFTLPAGLPAGTYVLSATITPTTLADALTTNNFVVSGAPFTTV